VNWDGPSLQPIFSWTEAGGERKCSMNKTLWAKVHLKGAGLQLSLHNDFTSEFLNREDHSRNLLGKHWQDKTVPHRANRRHLPSIGYQFPCVKLRGILENVYCRLCKRLHPDTAPWPQSLGHVQAQCPALRKPRIAVHHCI